MKRFLTFLKVEGKLSLRCPDGIIFGIGMPVGVLLLIAVVAGSQSAGGADYSFLQSAFASLLTVGICATAFMGLPLTIADYRDKKILKHFFATPIRPFMILSVQVVIGMLTSFFSAALVSLLAIFGFGYRMEGNPILFIGAFLLVMLSMYSIGMILASLCKTVKIANVVTTFVYFPMLFLSCNHPLRAVSGHCAKGMQCPAADTWYQAVKGGFFKHVESGDMDICRPFDCFRSCRLYHFCCII